MKIRPILTIDHPTPKDIPVISGKAKVCDKSTGECWEVEDGKKGDTPPIKKTKSPKK